MLEVQNLRQRVSRVFEETLKIYTRNDDPQINALKQLILINQLCKNIITQYDNAPPDLLVLSRKAHTLSEKILERNRENPSVIFLKALLGINLDSNKQLKMVEILEESVLELENDLLIIQSIVSHKNIMRDNFIRTSFKMKA
jgi:hypothetical protein